MICAKLTLSSDFQSLTDEDIGVDGWSDAKVIDEKHAYGNDVMRYRVNILCYHVSQLKLATNSKAYNVNTNVS